MTNPSRLASRTSSPLSFIHRARSSVRLERGAVIHAAAPRDDPGTGPSGTIPNANEPAVRRNLVCAPVGRNDGRPPRAEWSEEFSMSSRRAAKVAEAVREQVSTTILFGLKDPRVKNVTVTRVEVSPDLRSAKVYVSVMGDEKMQQLSLRGLESARGFLQAKLAERVQIRYTPVLHFQLDQGVKRSIEASRLLREVLPPSPEESAPLDAEDAGSEDEFPENAVFDEGCAGPVSPAVPIPKSYERHTENQDG